MSYKEQLQANNTEISANTTDIQAAIDMVNALPESTSGAEVVTGSFTLSSGSSGSITIPGLIGKENFSLAFHGDLMSLSVMTIIRCQLLAETNAFVYEFVDPDASFYVGEGTAGLGATMWDSSTGTLTRTTPPSYFLAGDWYYIGW